MSASRRNRLRLAGIVALVCAGAVFAADVTMLGLPVSGAEAAAVDYRNLLRLPEWRLRVGGYGAFLIFGFLAGTWQLYEGIKPAGAWWSLPPFLFISYFFASGAIFHYLLAFAIAAGKSQAEAQGAGGQVAAALVQTARAYLLVPFYVSVASLVIGSIWFAATVLLRPTHFPRWMTLLSPALPIGAAYVITMSLPAPVGGYLVPPVVHLATPIIFGASTALLWNVGRDSSNEASRK